MRHCIRRRIVSLLLSVLFLPALSGCGNLVILTRQFMDQPSEQKTEQSLSGVDISLPTQDTAQSAAPYSGAAPSPASDIRDYSGRQTPLYEQYSYYLPNMDEKERANFLALYEGTMNFQESIPLPYQASADEVADLMLLLGNECPELLQLDLTWQQRSNLLGNIVSVSPSYIMDQETYNAQRSAIEDLLTQWHTQLDSLGSYDVELTIYNYIINNCVYSLDTENCQTAYGALIGGFAKCDGRAKALVWGLRSFGITCSLISGSNHAWVIARIDGYDYNADPTYDDNESDGHQYPSSYAYLNVPQSAIAENPYPADEFYQKRGYPQTVRWDANYHVKSGVWIAAGQNARDSFLSQLETAAAQKSGTIRLRFESTEDFAAANNASSGWIQEFLNQKGLSCNITTFDCSDNNTLFIELTF